MPNSEIQKVDGHYVFTDSRSPDAHTVFMTDKYSSDFDAWDIPGTSRNDIFEINGNNDNNVIKGGASYTEIYAGGGDDTIIHGGGAAQLYGGDGADKFVFDFKDRSSVAINDFDAEDIFVVTRDSFDGLVDALSFLSTLDSAIQNANADGEIEFAHGNSKFLINTNGIESIQDFNIEWF